MTRISTNQISDTETSLKVKSFRFLLLFSLLILACFGFMAIWAAYVMHKECRENDTDECDLEPQQFLNQANIQTMSIRIGDSQRAFKAYTNCKRGMKVYTIVSMNDGSQAIVKLKNAVSNNQQHFCAFPASVISKSNQIQSLIAQGYMTSITFGDLQASKSQLTYNMSIGEETNNLINTMTIVVPL